MPQPRKGSPPPIRAKVKVGMRFEPFASSSDGCAYRVSVPGRAPLLIDCGLSIGELRKALYFQVTSLAGCLISHAHGDHSKAWIDLGNAGVDCYASKETWAQLTGKATKPFSPHRCKTFRESGRGDAILAYDQQEVGPWTVRPFPVVHDCEGTLGFIIGSPDGDRLLYLTDSMYSPFRFEGLTHVAIECNHSEAIIRQNSDHGAIDRSRFRRTAQTHMSLERLIPMLKSNDLSKVEEIHLLHLSDANSNEDEFRIAVQSATGIPVYVAAAHSKLQ